MRGQRLPQESGSGHAVDAQHQQREGALQRAVQGRRVANDAAELDLDARLHRNARCQVQVDKAAVEQAVDVVEVQAARAGGDEAARHGRRVIGVGAAARRVTLAQPHDFTVQNVNGGNDQHSTLPSS